MTSEGVRARNEKYAHVGDRKSPTMTIKWKIMAFRSADDDLH